MEKEPQDETKQKEALLQEYWDLLKKEHRTKEEQARFKQIQKEAEEYKKEKGNQ